MKAWDEFVLQLKTELNPQAVQKWLDPLKVLRFDAGNLYLEAKDHFQAHWFEEHIRPKINHSFLNNNHRPIKVHLSVANTQKHSPLRKKGHPRQSETFPPAFELTFDQLDPYTTFDNFIPAKSNMMTLMLLKELVNHLTGQPLTDFTAEEMGTYNPIYIHGLSGSGKTHLLQATAHALTEKGVKTLYTRAELFTDHVVHAIRAGEMSHFRQTYRNIDVLIIDDVDIFSRKGATQEELFHTFNALHLAGKQIILSSKCAPKELQLIEQRLISRFEWGIVLPIGLIDQQQMSTMLHKKTHLHHHPLNNKVEKFLIDTFGSNPKSLTKALEALILRGHLNQEPGERDRSENYTTAEIKHLLSDLIKQEETLVLSPDRILSAVADFYSIPTDDIRGKSQKREAALPRQISMYLCRQKLNLPYMKIGDLFDRDHSTVMTSIRRIDKDCITGNKEITHALNAILSKLQTIQ